VVEAFYPGQFGGTAISSILYGLSPSGRLPYTIYDADFTTRRPDIGLIALQFCKQILTLPYISIGEMSLSTNGGITYQYYEGKPLWPFGYGLSYTSFGLSWAAPSNLSGTSSTLNQLSYGVNVVNTGAVVSDVSVLAYLTHQSTAAPGPLPRRELFAFCRIRDLHPGAPGKNCTLAVSATVVAHGGEVYSGDYAIAVELGDGTSLLGSLAVAALDISSHVV